MTATKSNVQVTPNVPASGAVSLSQIKAAFPGVVGGGAVEILRAAPVVADVRSVQVLELRRAFGQGPDRLEH